MQPALMLSMPRSHARTSWVWVHPFCSRTSAWTNHTTSHPLIFLQQVLASPRQEIPESPKPNFQKGKYLNYNLQFQIFPTCKLILRNSRHDVNRCLFNKMSSCEMKYRNDCGIYLFLHRRKPLDRFHCLRCRWIYQLSAWRLDIFIWNIQYGVRNTSYSYYGRNKYMLIPQSGCQIKEL